jgi:hypothetical protein
MTNLKLAKLVAFRAFGRRLSYKASGDVEKMMGEILGEELGIDDAPKEFFTKAKENLKKALDEAGLDLDMDDTDVYPYLRRNVLETADDMDMIK